MKSYLFSSPRSGSTFVMDLLDQMEVDMTPSYDYFYSDSKKSPFLTDEGVIIGKPHKRRDGPVLKNTFDEVMRRLDVLRCSKPNYVFKFFPRHLEYYDQFGRKTFDLTSMAEHTDFMLHLSKHPVFLYLKDECRGVRLIRRDKTLQFLSVLKAKYTGVYILKHGNIAPPEPISFKVTRKDFDDFLANQKIFTRIGESLKLTNIIYEEILADPLVLNQAFGLTGLVPKSRLMVQRNVYDWVQNLAEVDNWFADWPEDIM